MIISRTRILETNDVRHYAWSGLSRYKNVALTTDTIFRYQLAPEHQKRNVEKQAGQIRYCIVQAEEYFNAARSVSLATKPLLLYYGVMSLALAELLIKQSGESSLDKARAKHAHHGLVLKLDDNPSGKFDLATGARALRAVPLVKSKGERSGTFELWHTTSRETPFSGEQKVFYENGVSTTTNGIVALGEDRRPDLLPEKGINLLDCFKSIPSMIYTLSSYGEFSNLVRGGISTTSDLGRKVQTRVTYIHPDRPEIMADTLDQFTFSPSLTDCVTMEQAAGAGGGVLTVTLPFECGQQHSVAPFGFQINKDEVFFSPRNNVLNEFGLYYFGLYILGNYARYYPDYWMNDVESATPLSLAASEFIVNCEERVPLLALSELSQVAYVLR